MLSFPANAHALSDADSKKLFVKLVHSYYESDADTFWEITSKFQEPMFDNKKSILRWMKDRLATQETFLKVKGVIVIGQARITSEELGDITFRFDGLINDPTRVIIVTAWVNRVIEFDEPVPQAQRKVDQVAILKIYVTIVEEKLFAFKSDEINFGYNFAGK
jgi:hypothetical protein